jgi:flagellar basal-body rod protein FlgG
MYAQQLNVDVISNNMANVNTAGYKKMKTDFQDLLYQTLKTPGTSTAAGSISPAGIQVGLGNKVVATVRLFSQGNFQETTNPLDIAIEGDGFFQIEKPDGEIAYSRAGSFKIDNEGSLITSEGMSLSPNVVIPENAIEISVGSDGTVSVLNGDTNLVEVLGTNIQLARFSNPTGLKAMGHNLYTQTVSSGDPTEGDPGSSGLGTLAQGFLELSNVSIVEEMVNLIAGQRSYEICSRAIQASDEMLQTANAIKR